MIYEFESNELDFKYRKMSLLIPALAISCFFIYLFSDFSYDLLGDSFKLLNINIFILFLIIITLTYLYQKMFIKCSITSEETIIKDWLYSSLGADNVNSKFLINFSDDRLIISSKNIENIIFYNEIKQVVYKKKFIILFLINESRVMLPNSPQCIQLKEELKLRLKK